MPRKQREVMHHYEQVMKALARSDRGADRQLAVDLVRYLGGRGWSPEPEGERPKGRDR
jgi:membrane protein required for beta-lactamase induction